MRVLGQYAYSLPVLSGDSVRVQYHLALLDAQRRATGPEPERSGQLLYRVFVLRVHNDGFASGLRAAAALPGVGPLFVTTNADFERREPFTTVTPVAWLLDVLEVVRTGLSLVT